MGRAKNDDGASWQSDPFGRHEQRWWDGTTWSEKVRSSGTTGIDPPGVDANPEHAHANVPVMPITDANRPVTYGSHYLPRVLVVAVVLLVGILVLLAFGLAS